MRRALAAMALLCGGCALPVVSAGTFLPAGDLQKGELHASASLEVGRVLAGPSDVHDLAVTPPGAQQWDVSTWFASDASLRWQALSRVSLEAQIKLTNPVVPFTPEVVGGSGGARVRLVERPRGEPGGFALELGGRFVGVGLTQVLNRSQSGRSREDRWTYRAMGVEVPLVATYRVSALLAVTASPFLRAYFIRAWHTVTEDRASSLAQLQWTPVLSGGLGAAAALDLGPVEIAPGLALELATRPGPNAKTQLLFQPGLSVGTRF